jgi:hypothetical protein
MRMKPALRKMLLSIHITASVGWIGAVIAYLILVLAAMMTVDNQLLISAWLAMWLIGVYALVPMSLAALLTGIFLSLGSQWGLFRHYWVLISLLLTLFATIVLIQHMQTVNFYHVMAAKGENLAVLKAALAGEVFHGGIGLLVLLLIQLLNIYKPRGLTPFGWRESQKLKLARSRDFPLPD